jgi:hypothetical protein
MLSLVLIGTRDWSQSNRDCERKLDLMVLWAKTYSRFQQGSFDLTSSQCDNHTPQKLQRRSRAGPWSNCTTHWSYTNRAGASEVQSLQCSSHGGVIPGQGPVKLLDSSLDVFGVGPAFSSTAILSVSASPAESTPGVGPASVGKRTVWASSSIGATDTPIQSTRM